MWQSMYNDRLSLDWIPAFAGMTSGLKARPSQMIPAASTARFCLTKAGVLFSEVWERVQSGA